MEEDAALRGVVKKALEGKGVLAQIRVSTSRSLAKNAPHVFVLMTVHSEAGLCNNGNSFIPPSLRLDPCTIAHTHTFECVRVCFFGYYQ